MRTHTSSPPWVRLRAWATVILTAPLVAVAPPAFATSPQGTAVPAGQSTCQDASVTSGVSTVALRLCLQTDGLTTDLTTARADCSARGVAFSTCLVEGKYTLLRDGVQIANPYLYFSTNYPGPGTYEVRFDYLEVTMTRADSAGQYREGFRVASPLPPLTFAMTAERLKQPVGASRIDYLPGDLLGPVQAKVTITNVGTASANGNLSFGLDEFTGTQLSGEPAVLPAPLTTDDRCLALTDEQGRDVGQAVCEVGDITPGQSVSIVLDVPRSFFDGAHAITWQDNSPDSRLDLGSGVYELTPDIL